MYRHLVKFTGLHTHDVGHGLKHVTLLTGLPGSNLACLFSESGDPGPFEFPAMSLVCIHERLPETFHVGTIKHLPFAQFRDDNALSLQLLSWSPGLGLEDDGHVRRLGALGQGRCLLGWEAPLHSLAN